MEKLTTFQEWLKKNLGVKVIKFSAAECGQRFDPIEYQYDPRYEKAPFPELEGSTFIKSDPFDLHHENPPLVKMCPFNAFTISGPMAGFGAHFEPDQEVILLDPL